MEVNTKKEEEEEKQTNTIYLWDGIFKAKYNRGEIKIALKIILKRLSKPGMCNPRPAGHNPAPRAIAVARGDGRTVFFFYLLRKNPIRLMAEFTTQEIKDVVLLTSE